MPLKVAFVVLHLDPGGYERVVLNLITHLDRRRFEPQLVLLHGHGGLCELLPEDVEVVRLATRTRSAAPTLARTLKRLGSQVVFAGPTPANFAALSAAALMRSAPPVIANEHTPPGLYFEELRLSQVYRLLMRHLYPRAACIGVPILEVGLELRDILDRPDLKILELKNPLFGADLPETAAQEPEVPVPPSPFFIAAGRMVKAKGFDVLLDAFAQLEKSEKTPYLMILGDGPERQPLLAQARELGIGDRVSLPGAVANPFPFYRRAHALVVSSRREAIPNVLSESMACGTPVIATECWTGPRALLEDGAAGLLVPPGDADSLAEAMQSLLEDEELAARLASRGVVRASAYRLENTVPAFEDLLEQVAQA